FVNRVFSAASAIGFVVGFALFGTIAYLPQYMQIVKGVSPTVSGLRLLPLMVGLLTTSIVSGRLVSRWGRYRIFPIVGTATMTVGLYLLSHLGVATSDWLSSLYMLVLGAGIGLSLQVLIVAVQNAVSYTDLGAATGGATFFRSIGGSFGTATFRPVFPKVLAGALVSAAGLQATPRGGWLLLRVGEHPEWGRHDLAEHLYLTDADFERRLTELTASGYVRPLSEDGAEPVQLTESGQRAFDDLFRAR